VLVNVPEPEQIVTEMAALVRPGGTVVLHEADYVAHVCDPPLPAWDRLVRVLKAYAEANGIDLFVGRRLPRLMRAAGLIDVRAHPIIHLYEPGHNRRSILLHFAQNLRDRILAADLISEGEFDDCLASLRRHLDDDSTLVVSHLFIQAWGTKTLTGNGNVPSRLRHRNCSCSACSQGVAAPSNLTGPCPADPPDRRNASTLVGQPAYAHRKLNFREEK
jgi:hypothetical protein